MYRLPPPDCPNGLILRIEDNVWIPQDIDNSDYQLYLQWLEEGNEPIPFSVELITEEAE